MFLKPKKHLRFLIRVAFDDCEAVLNKISPILNQLSVDETTNIDDLLFSFFTERHSPFFDNKKLTAKVYFTMWKNRNVYNYLKIKPLLFLEYILKFKKKTHQNNWLPKQQRTPFKLGVRGREGLIFKSYGLIFGLSESTFWSVVGGYQFYFDKIFPGFHRFRGVEHSYKYRASMLGRKINFRRKVRKQTFEEY